MTDVHPTTRPVADGVLSRIAGGAAILAGTLLTVTQLGIYATFDRTDMVASSAGVAFRSFSIGHALAFALLVLAVVALYVRSERQGGWGRFSAFAAAALGTMALGADMWFEAFTAPWLMEVLPQVATVPKTAIWQAGFLSSFVLFAVGWVAFGVSCLRTKELPPAISVAIVVGGVVGFWAAQPPFALPLALALVAAGVWVRHADRAPAQG